MPQLRALPGPKPLTIWFGKECASRDVAVGTKVLVVEAVRMRMEELGAVDGGGAVVIRRGRVDRRGLGALVERWRFAEEVRAQVQRRLIVRVAPRVKRRENLGEVDWLQVWARGG